MIYVIKRDGKREALDITKIQKYTKTAVKGKKNVSQSELEVDAHIQFNKKITTEQIQDILTKTAVSKIDIDRPDWTFVAASLFVHNLYHMVGKTLNGQKGSNYGHIKDYLEYGEKVGKIFKGLKDKFLLEKINVEIDPRRDDMFTYLGMKTLYDRYLLKDKDGKPFELPQHMFMGIAMFLSINETNVESLPKNSFERKLIDTLNGIDVGLSHIHTNTYSKEDIPKIIRTFWTIKFYHMISKFEVMLATPTLSNARTTRHQLSSCYIGSTPDNIEGIFDAYKEMALLSKFGGGIGWDWNNVRGIGAAIDNNKGAGGGTIPFLKITNDIAIAVDQLGTRKGAIAVYMQPWHIDILDFLDLKKNSGEERRRAHDLFPALWLNDEFMKRAQNNKDWTLFNPYDVQELNELYGEEFRKKYEEFEKDESIPRERINAKELWKKILISYFETGTPFLTFKDEANRRNPNAHEGIIRSSNLCTEIFQNTEPNTYKVKIKFENGDIELFDEEEELELDNGITKTANKVTSIDTYKNRKIYFVDKVQVNGKTAVCNLASINLSKVNKKEDLEQIIPLAVRCLDNVIDLNFYPAEKVKETNLQSRSIGLGIMGEAQMLAENQIFYGSEKHFEKIDEIMEIVSFNAIKASHELSKERGSYKTFEGSNWNKGITPIDNANEEAKKLTTRPFIYNWDELKEKIKTGMRNGYLMAIAPTSSISILVGTTQTIEPIYKRKWSEENLSGLIPVTAPNLNVENYQYYTPAYEVKQIKLIEAGAVRQKWIDQGQSLNIFLTLDKASGKVLNEIYMKAWKLGLKSTYYLRSESPSEKKQDIADRSMECAGCQ